MTHITRVLQAGKWNFERGQKRSKMPFLGLKMIIFRSQIDHFWSVFKVFNLFQNFIFQLAAPYIWLIIWFILLKDSARDFDAEFTRFNPVSSNAYFIVIPVEISYPFPNCFPSPLRIEFDPVWIIPIPPARTLIRNTTIPTSAQWVIIYES